jgi:hypothetical protein
MKNRFDGGHCWVTIDEKENRNGEGCYFCIIIERKKMKYMYV